MSNCPILKDPLEKQEQVELLEQESLPRIGQRFVDENVEPEFLQLPPPMLLDIDIPIPNNSPNVREITRIVAMTTTDRIFILD